MIKTSATAAVLLASAAVSVNSIAAESAKSVVGAPSTNRWTQALIDRMDADKSGTLETTEYENREYFKREIQR